MIQDHSRFTVCAAMLAISIGAVACGGGKNGAKKGAVPTEKVLHDRRASAHKSLDPMKQFDSASAEIVSNVYDSLLQYSYLERPYALEPNLLTAMPELSEDSLTYTFKLRKDVRFIDDKCFKGGKGRALTADDAIYSLKRFADANTNIKSYMFLKGVVVGMDEFREKTKQAGAAKGFDHLDIEGLKKIDDHTFTMTLTRPNPMALFPLASTQIAIVPREAVDHYKDEFERHPVGTGPFFAEKISRRGVLILKRNPNYHQTYPTKGAPGDEEKGFLVSAGKKLPLIDEVRLPLIEEAQPAMLKFKSGKLDWIGIDRDNFTKMAYKDDKGFHLTKEYAAKFDMYAEPLLVSSYLVFNLSDPLLGKNKKLRQAIAHALDTETFVKQMRNGRGSRLNSIVPHAIGGSERDTGAQFRKHDVAAAKRLLAEAGFPGGKGLPTLTVEYRASTSLSRQDFEFHRNLLAQVGITLKANFQTFSAFLKKIESGNFQLSDAGWAADYPDAENFFQLVYGPNKVPGPNASGYNNPEYNRLYEQSRFMHNGKERYAIFKRMAEIMNEDVPIIITWTPIAFGLHQRWLSNLKRNVMIDKPYKYLDIDPVAKARGLK